MESSLTNPHERATVSPGMPPMVGGRRRRLHPVTLVVTTMIVVGLSAFLLYGVLNPASSTPNGIVALGRVAPDFRLSLVNAPGNMALSQWRGHPVVVNFWASWCETCKQEAPILSQVMRQYAGSNVVFLGVDEQEQGLAATKIFLAYYHLSGPVVYDTNGDALTSYGVTGFPETFFVNANGVVVNKYVGPFQSAQTLTAMINHIGGRPRG